MNSSTSTLTVTADSQFATDDQRTCAFCANPTCIDSACKKQGKWKNRFLKRLKNRLQMIIRPLSKSDHPLPPPDANWEDKLAYDFRLPPTGIVSRGITLIMLAVFIW